MDKTVTLPEPPVKPLNLDCCGNGCTPCIFDIYEEDLRIWQLECVAIQNGEGCQSDTNKEKEELPRVTLKPDEYVRFPITTIAKETSNALRFTFSLQPSQTLGLAVGQHIIIRSSSICGSTLTRQFTPVSPLDAKGYFELLIKVYPNGRMSKYIKDWQVGDEIEMRGPLGSLQYKTNEYDCVLVLCAGTGIAPMCQIIHTILDNEEEETRVRLLYACRTYQDLLLKTELDEWQRFWNFSSLFVLSQEPDFPQCSYKYGDTIHKGHIDRSLLFSELQHKIDNTLVLICGTRSFDSDILMFLEEIGIPSSHIHKF